MEKNQVTTDIGQTMEISVTIKIDTDGVPKPRLFPDWIRKPLLIFSKSLGSFLCFFHDQNYVLAIHTTFNACNILIRKMFLGLYLFESHYIWMFQRPVVHNLSCHILIYLQEKAMYINICTTKKIHQQMAFGHDVTVAMEKPDSLGNLKPTLTLRLTDNNKKPHMTLTHVHGNSNNLISTAIPEREPEKQLFMMTILYIKSGHWESNMTLQLYL